MKCSCGHEQVSGKFCGKCGARLGNLDQPMAVEMPLQSEQVLSNTATVDTSIQLDNLKQKSLMYWNYFLQHLKNPSKSFTSQNNDFTNALISLIIYAAIFGYTFYRLVDGSLGKLLGALSSFIGDETASIPFSSIFFKTVIYVAIIMAIVTLALFIVGKYFGPDHSVKKTMVIYSAHSLPAIVIGLAAFLLILLNSLTYGGVLLLASLVYVVLLSPGYVISVLLSRKPKGVDPLFGYTIYSALITVVIWITLKSLWNSSGIKSAIDQLKELQGFF